MSLYRFAVILIVLGSVTSAQAHGHHRHYRPHYGARHYAYRHVARIAPQKAVVWGILTWPQQPQPVSFGVWQGTEMSRPADCYGIPWCGCYMRHVMGVADKSYNLARTWLNYGHPTGPQVGAIVVWRGHVGRIVGQDSAGQWLVLNGNYRNRVATVAMSLRGAIGFRI